MRERRHKPPGAAALRTRSMESQADAQGQPTSPTEGGELEAAMIERLMRENAQKDEIIRQLQQRIAALEEHKAAAEGESKNGSSEDAKPLQFSALHSETIDLFEAARRSVAAGIRDPASITLTDQDSIRRRYTALDVANPDGIAAINPKTLFKSTFILDYVTEDSPTNRKKMQTMDASVEGLKDHLIQLVTEMRKFCNASTAAARSGKAVSEEMMHLRPESWFTRMGDLGAWLVRFGEIFDEIQNCGDAVTLSLETAFSAPMEDFIKREMKTITAIRQELHSSLGEYESQLAKYLQLKRSADESVIGTRHAEMMAAKRRYELARFDMVNALNSLEKKKKFQLVERLCSFFYSYLGFFHRCHMICAAQEPFVRDLQHAVLQARKDFQKEEKLTAAKRVQLEAELNTAFLQTTRRPSGTPIVMSDTIRNALKEAVPGSTKAAPRSHTFRPTSASKLRKLVSPGGSAPDNVDAAIPPAADAATSPRGKKKDRDTSPKRGFIKSLTMRESSKDKGLKSHKREHSDPTELHPPSPASQSPAAQSGSFFPANEDQDATVSSPTSEQKEDELLLGRTSTHSMCSHDEDIGADIGADEPVELVEEVNVLETHTDASIQKQGYLWKRSTNVRKDWKRRWFILREGVLMYMREQDAIAPPIFVCNILLSTVRECRKDNDLRFCFEIISPNQRSYRLQAESEEEFKDWTRVLREEIERALVGVEAPKRDQGDASQSTRNLHVMQVMSTNPTCADCGAPHPDWLLVNLGAVVCIECSGVHRSLGVHISKVRSLTLDAMSTYTLALFELIGNEGVNSVWEANVPEGAKRPSPNSPPAEKREWILAKYARREFLGGVLEDPDPRLYQACEAGNLLDVVRLLAHGADVNFRNEEAHKRTPLHAAAAAGHFAVTELLTQQHNCVLDAQDDEEHTALDLAMAEQHARVIQVLVQKLERELA